MNDPETLNDRDCSGISSSEHQMVDSKHWFSGPWDDVGLYQFSLHEVVSKNLLTDFFFLQVGSFHLPHGDFFIEPVKNLSLATGSSHPHVIYKKPRVPEAKESACGLMGTVIWSAPCFGLFSYHTTSAYSHLASLFLLLKMMHPYQCCTSLSASEKRGKASPN